MEPALLARPSSLISGDRRRWVALVVLCLGQLMIVLDATIVNVALPSIQRDLHFTQANLTWVVNAYLITFGSFLLLAGRLGDLIGRKRIFLSGLVLFTLASVLCGFAQSEVMLIAARLLQGIGGAVASSVIIAIIVTEFPAAREQGKAMGVFAFVASAGGSIGLLAGGVLTETISWHWIFFINVPIGLVAIAMGVALVKENAGAGPGKGVDVAGSILITVAMMLGVYTIVKTSDYGWGSARTLGFGALSLALIGAFLAYQARISNPIVPLRVLRTRSLAGANLVRGFLVTGMFAAFFLGALYLQHVRGYSAIETGLAFTPTTLSIGTLSVGITARLALRFGARRTMIPGLVSVLVGLLFLARVPLHASYWPDLFPAFLLIGIGAGLSFMPLITLAMSEVRPADAGLGSGLVNVSQQLAAALGVAVLGTLAASRTKHLLAAGHSSQDALTSGFHLAFFAAATSVLVGLALAVFALRPSTSRLVEPARATASAHGGGEAALERS
ncbi:MAG: MFS transporter [Thermoleophilaceae bacterium]